MDRRALIGLSTGAVLSAFSASAQTPPPAVEPLKRPNLPEPSETIDLWPKGAPGLLNTALKEIVSERSSDPQINDRAILGISKPRMVVFRPDRPNGAAIIVAPGGGYRWVVVDKEGYEIARWLAARGFTVFVLFYRLPSEGWRAGADVALADAQRAMRLIRHHAKTYGIMPERVGMMGFSAGGHLCADLAARFAVHSYDAQDDADQHSARPFLAAPIYPVVTMDLDFAHKGSRDRLLGPNPTPELERLHSPHRQVPANAPPHFILHAEDDDAVPVQNSLLLAAALRAQGAVVETHLFTQGGHGFGLRKAVGKPVELWPDLFRNWARSVGFG